MADNFPIDIDFKKVTEWLQERRKIPKEWGNKLKAAKIKTQKIIEETQLASVPEAQAIISQNKDDLTFFHITKICDILVGSSEAKQKTFLGQYSSKVINDWITLRKFYEKDNLHIVDLSKTMVQNATFEIPALKRMKNSFEAQLQETYQKIQDSKNAIKAADREYLSQCEKLGLKGENLVDELLHSLTTLPEIFNKFVQLLKSQDFKTALQYYKDFTVYINEKQDREKLKFPLLDYLVEHDNDLLELWKMRRDGKGGNVPADLLDFNGKRYENYQETAKWYKDEKAKSGGGALEIDWSSINFGGISLEGGGNENAGNNGGINWDEFIVVDSAANNNNNNNAAGNNKDDATKWEIVDEQTAKKEPQSQYSRETILSDLDSRNELIAYLNELLFFIKQRIEESQYYSGNSLLQIYEHDSSSALFEVNVDKFKAWEKLIHDAIESISNYQVRHLFIIKDQPKAKDRLISYLNTFKSLATKHQGYILGYEKKVVELQGSIKEHEAKVKVLSDQTIEYKAMIENLMKAVIKREVHLLGDVNNLNKQMRWPHEFFLYRANIYRLSLHDQFFYDE
eukprot:TRINITY_DN2683_c0_g1_i4.p1 TRINITY_DN2683_c0_g1~~TRINITY_DN2683_c0_g1_i4.p1  ORF type:complete len:568 (+),score=182.76 TRINITY_DN2683_c0_g1_i4:168-1871(+)